MILDLYMELYERTEREILAVMICGGGGYPSFYHYICLEFIFSANMSYNQKFRKIQIFSDLGTEYRRSI